MNMLSAIEPLSEQTYQLFRKLIYEKTGIHMRDCKQILVANRLRRRLLQLGPELLRGLLPLPDRVRRGRTGSCSPSSTR